MRRHNGRQDGVLQCDGPDGKKCRLIPGNLRWSCEQCDFDICEECAEPSWEDQAVRANAGGISQAQKQANYECLLAQQELHDAMFGDELNQTV